MNTPSAHKSGRREIVKMTYGIGRPETMRLRRLKLLLAGLQLEMARPCQGLRLTNKRRSCYAIIKSEFRLRGNRYSVFDQYKKILAEFL